jgi:hypothetical protein
MRKVHILLLIFTLCSCSTTTKRSFKKIDVYFAEYDRVVSLMEKEFSKNIVAIKSNDWVKLKLSHMVKVDQYMRKFPNLLPDNGTSKSEKKYFKSQYLIRFTAIDKGNTKELKKLLKVYNWFKISEFGEQVDKNAWLLVQHADQDLRFQKNILKTLTSLYKIGETDKSNYAYLYDRVKSIGEGLPQKYGTQGKCIGVETWQPYKILNPINVDKRRKEMGMVSMAVYKIWFKDICK